MKIEDALKLSDIAVNSIGIVVNKCNEYWYFKGGNQYPLHELIGKYDHNTTWQPAYIRPQFQIGEKVSFLQACLSGQCFVADGSENIRRCIDIKLGKMKVYNADSHWVDTVRDFCPSDIVTIVSDPSQEQPAKRQRTHAEILADIKTLVSELESARSE